MITAFQEVGSVKGTIQNQQVAFGVSSKKIGGSNDLTWDGLNLFVNNRTVSTLAFKAKEINKMSDFPAPVAGVITLVGGTNYIINEPLTTSDRFVIPTGTTINFTAATFNIGIGITYTGSDTLFTGTDITAFQMFDLQFINTGSGTLYSISAGASNFPLINFLQCLAVGWASLGNITNARFFGLNSAHVNNGTGLTLTDATRIDLVRGTYFNTVTSNAALFTITGTAATTGSFDNVRLAPLAGESGINIVNTLDADAFIIIDTCIFTGAGSALNPEGLNTKDTRVRAFGNSGLRDSRNIGSLIAQGNDVETVIVDQGEGESNYVDLNLGEASGSITVFANNGSGGTRVTSATHGEPNEKLVEITGTTSYNGKHEIFAVAANTFDIDIAFVADDGTGTWTSGAFEDVDIERWELNNAANGELKYIGKEAFDGELIATIGALAVGGAARRYKFRAVVAGVDGFAIPNEIKSTVTETTLRKGISVVTNNLVKIQVANFAGTQNIIIDTLSIGIK